MELEIHIAVLETQVERLHNQVQLMTEGEAPTSSHGTALRSLGRPRLFSSTTLNSVLQMCFLALQVY